MNSCFDVGYYFLKNQDLEAGDLMSNMKLQKLVYYAQGFYLAIKEKPLFPEPLVAWAMALFVFLFIKSIKISNQRQFPFHMMRILSIFLTKKHTKFYKWCMFIMDSLQHGC